MTSSQSKVVNISSSESLRRVETSRVVEIRKISTTEYCARTSFPWHSVEFRLDGFFWYKIMIRIYQHAYFSACILAAQFNVSRAEKAPQTLGLSHELYHSNQWVRKQVSTPISLSTVYIVCETYPENNSLLSNGPLESFRKSDSRPPNNWILDFFLL